MCDKIIDGVSSLKSSISIFGLNFGKNSMDKIFEVINLDFPELFYLDISNTSIYSTGLTMTVKPSFFYPKDVISSMRTEIESKAKAITKNLPSGASALFKERTIHNYLAGNVKYAYNSNSKVNIFSIAGVFIDKSAVCEGYSKAFKYLCDMNNIPCIIVKGTSARRGSGGSMPHAWNIVKLNNDYFHVDVTWDSCSFHENADSFTFYNQSDDSMSFDHIWDKSQVPECKKGNGDDIPVCETEKQLEELICRNIRNNVLNFKVIVKFSSGLKEICSFTEKILERNMNLGIRRYYVSYLEGRNLADFTFNK